MISLRIELNSTYKITQIGNKLITNIYKYL